MLSRAFARVAQRAILWCLLFAAPLYAVSSAVAQVMGSQHARRVVTHVDQPSGGWHHVHAFGHDWSGASHIRSTFEGQCESSAAAAVAVLDAAAFDSLGDDSPDATSGFGLAMTSAAPIEPTAPSTSPPRHSTTVAVLTGEGNRLDRPPKT